MPELKMFTHKQDGYTFENCVSIKKSGSVFSGCVRKNCMYWNQSTCDYYLVTGNRRMDGFATGTGKVVAPVCNKYEPVNKKEKKALSVKKKHGQVNALYDNKAMKEERKKEHLTWAERGKII